MDRTHKMGCDACSVRGQSKFQHPFEMAFQPIVNADSGEIFAHEALVRGPGGEGARTVLQKVDETNRYGFDQACRVRAIERAAEYGVAERVSINFMPNAVYEPRNCIQRTLWAADKCDMPVDRIIFEFTENERIIDPEHLVRIMREYRHQGFLTAIDDFGAGYSGLNLLAEIQPDLIKLDMAMIRGIDRDDRRQTIVRGLIAIARDLGIELICEGIETTGERDVLADLGITLMQGYLFARPVFRGISCPDDLQSVARAA